MKYISNYEKFNEEFLDKLKKVFARKDDELANTIYDTLLNIAKVPGKFKPTEAQGRVHTLNYKITETGKLSGAKVSIYMTDRNSGGNSLWVDGNKLDCSGGIVNKILELLKKHST